MKKICFGFTLLLLMGCGKDEIETISNFETYSPPQNYKSNWGANNTLFMIPTGPNPSDFKIGCTSYPSNCYDVFIVYNEEVEDAIYLDQLIGADEITDTLEYHTLLKKLTTLSEHQIDSIVDGSVTVVKVPNDNLFEPSIKVYLAFKTEILSQPIEFSNVELDEIL